MKKILSAIVCTLFVTLLFAQDTPDTAIVVRKRQPPPITRSSNDHLLVQFGYTDWASSPDSVKDRKAGFSKSFNVYLMYDFPFKTNPKLSMAFGPGIATDHVVFGSTFVGIKELTPTIRFSDRSDTDHFKKTKIATAYLEAPIEFRYTKNPYKPNSSLKAAIGVKVGTLINAHTRNTKLENRSGNSLNDYTLKESSKRFFNKTRLVAMGRVGVGHWSLYGSYQLTALFKDGLGPQVKPFSIGITLSGL